jgi:hypothetical protein
MGLVITDRRGMLNTPLYESVVELYPILNSRPFLLTANGHSPQHVTLIREIPMPDDLFDVRNRKSLPLTELEKMSVY